MKTRTKLIISSFFLIFSFVGLLWLLLILVLFPHFIDKIELINEFQEPIKISIIREEDDKAILPMTFSNKLPAMPSPRNAEYWLLPKDTIVIMFDAQACYVNRILVELNNQMKIMNVPYEYKGQNSYEIEDYLLKEPSEGVLKSFAKEKEKNSFWGYVALSFISILGLFNIYYFIHTWRVLRREKKRRRNMSQP